MNCVLYEPENMLLNTTIVPPSGKPLSLPWNWRSPKRHIWRQFHSFVFFFGSTTNMP